MIPLEDRLRAQYGTPGPASWIVVLLCDASGEVGGYRAGLAITDSPIAFYRADGSFVGTFHAFSPEENVEHAPAIEELRRLFPYERPFEPA